MARTWLSIQVELIDGMHAHHLWPRPGRVLLARPGMTFRMLADAINDAFARWELSHLHAFTFADGTRVAMRTRWDELDDESLDDTTTTMSRLSLGEQFTFEFDIGDSWMHLCTVADRKVDPVETYGAVPDRPVPYFGWGAIPDQHGRRWAGDDGSTPVPPQPDPPLSDLPDLHDTWGSRAFRVAPDLSDEGGDGNGDGTVIAGPWARGDTLDGGPRAWPRLPWSPDDAAELRAAVRRGDTSMLTQLLLDRDVLAVAHQAAPGLLHAVAFERDLDATATAVVLVEELSGRGWPGDDELAAAIERALVPPGSEALRPVPIDLEDLAMHLEGPGDPEGDWRLELATGRLWPAGPAMLIGEDEPDDVDDPNGFVTIVSLGSGPGYGDMRAFIATVDDAALAERLQRAIDGRGAFRRFKDVVFQDDATRHAWTLHASERQLGRARWWLAEAGLRPEVG